MKDEIRLKLLFSISLICVIALAAQSYYIYSNRAQTASLASDNSIPESIERRLTEHMAKPDRIGAQPSSQYFGQAYLSDPFQRMQEQMDQLMGSFGTGFDSLFDHQAEAFGEASFGRAQPNIELSETEKEFLISLSLPDGKDVQLDTALEENTLQLNGTFKTEKSEAANGRSFSSSSISQFSRSIPLPEQVDEFGLTTSQSDDKIVVRIPKKVS